MAGAVAEINGGNVEPLAETVRRRTSSPVGVEMIKVADVNLGLSKALVALHRNWVNHIDRSSNMIYDAHLEAAFDHRFTTVGSSYLYLCSAYTHSAEFEAAFSISGSLHHLSLPETTEKWRRSPEAYW